MYLTLQKLAVYSEQHIEDADAPLFLRFINLLINDAIFLLDEALDVSCNHQGPVLSTISNKLVHYVHFATLVTNLTDCFP